jgi:hypothetical protein
VTVTACKVEDADGDIATTDDRTPLENWAMDLRIDGVAQGITLTTALDGCAAWDRLAPGFTYGVQEEVIEGWLNLTSQSHDFSPAESGDDFTHTFINSQFATVTACKVEDADGDAATTGDQTPLENWAIDLRIDGVAQGITQTTGIDGCVSWDNLALGPAYGVQEETADGWLNLTAQAHDFSPAQSGDELVHTFANSRYVSVTACKLEDADGLLVTDDDRAPVLDWTITLTVDSIRQEPGQVTSSDGCYAWNGLAPGSTYGLEEALEEGWRALTPVMIEFEPAVSGGDYQYTFINTQATLWFLYLPLLSK